MSIIKKCDGCGVPLTEEVYRIDKGSFGIREIDHFLEDFKFDKHIGYFCSDCFKKLNLPVKES